MGVVNSERALAIRPVNGQMFTIPSFLGFLLPLPALYRAGENDQTHRRRRAVQGLRLSPYILKDVGMDDYDSPADDPRWVQRPDLER